MVYISLIWYFTCYKRIIVFFIKCVCVEWKKNSFGSITIFKSVFLGHLGPRGGGGGGYSPQILVGMCRGKVKNWQGLRNELLVEHENVGLRNELEPFWAWKCGAPERAWSVLSVKMRISGTAANLRRCRMFCIRAELALGGDERVEI